MTVSVEIKVKCNRISTSPFIARKNDIKLQHGRFTLMQLYKKGKMLRPKSTCDDEIEGDSEKDENKDTEECNSLCKYMCEWGEFTGTC